jgi:hypothetical protein
LIFRYAEDAVAKPEVASELFGILDQAEMARDKYRGFRRVLYEESNALAEDEKAFISGFIRGMGDEEEFLMRIFLREIVNYFRADARQEYSHQIMHILDSLRRALGKMLDTATNESEQHKRIVIVEMGDQLKKMTWALEFLVSRWARVAEAYADVRRKMVPIGSTNFLTDVQLLFGDQEEPGRKSSRSRAVRKS